MTGEEKLFKALGQRVRTLRKRRGYSQEDMIGFGFSARHWQQIESGRPITVRTLFRIADSLKVPVTGLFPSSRSHEVAAYRNDAAFVGDFTRFIEAALKSGNAVIVIVTESHRGKLLQRLQAHGCNIAAAIKQGTYISLDVSDALSMFMVNDWPDTVQFFKVTTDLIKKAAKAAKGTPPRVAACGECAPTLWAQGKAEAAIRVEQLWDKLARSHDVDTLCGYLSAGPYSKKDTQTFQRICAEHSIHTLGEDAPFAPTSRSSKPRS